MAERSEYVTAVEAASSSARKCIAIDEEFITARRGQGSLNEEIEKSKEHWTVVGRQISPEEINFIDNHRHFELLLRKCRMSRSSRRFHTRWARFLPKHEFFRDYGDSLKIGQKIGEGGQAEIYEATLDGTENCVVKMFKQDYSIADLQRQWTFTPHGDSLSGKNSSWKLFRNKCCFIKGGTLLKNNRFAFVMKRYWGDLRKHIDEQSTHPPFQYPLPIMLEIALGMKELHKSDILHRDLKASNILIGSSDNSMELTDKKGLYRFHCYIADFESSNDCQGTGYWRAPEVLLAVRKRGSNQEIWTKKVDVYSYAMTCYEILTGGLPLKKLTRNERDADAVIAGDERPDLPDYVDYRVKDLLRRCWHSDPIERPTFVQIVRELEALRRTEPTFFFTNYNGVG